MAEERASIFGDDDLDVSAFKPKARGETGERSGAGHRAGEGGLRSRKFPEPGSRSRHPSSRRAASSAGTVPAATSS